MAMKKLYRITRGFITAHYKQAVLYTVLVFVISSVAIYSSELRLIASFPFAFSIGAVIRLTTYKTGKIPIIMIDKTWDRYRRKYSGEELEQKYRELSLKNASVFFLIEIITLLIWGICEVLRLF